MKYHIKTFGCQMNVCDSDWLAQALYIRGWEPAAEEEADAILVNTCSVREKPEQKVYSQLGRLKRSNPGAVVGVGGCVAQQVGERFWERFPHVRLVFGPDAVPSVPESLERLAADPGLRISLLDFCGSYPERERVWSLTQQPAQRFVTIMQGCDNFCAYCIVPFTRGRQRSRDSSEVLRECQELVGSGVREITLLGQNVNSYGRDRGEEEIGFADLLERVCSIPGLMRVRFTTSHPKDLDGEVIDAFARLEALCPALHLPLQAGSDRILQRMGRKYTRQGYFRLVEELRAARPDIVLSTDLMVGFPSETEEDFQQTLDAMQRSGFDSSFSFKYSDRPGTRAANMPDKVGEAVKADRLERLQALQEELTARSLGSLQGETVTVLVEGADSRNNGSPASWRGREPGGRVVNFSGTDNRDLTGSLVPVRVREVKKHSVYGEVVNEPW
ncbi:MAG: tRNA (N6-isopentenyl adenosine(37)-C2)-methylthiotransferase MiaB [Desulfohalobiaceae bacterium]|nr:tRNA (N6-isopentenyl adenosine(37)-C2)-methylthiotransferase MiaB [Desulfohalobiaceae bacterium]